MDIDDLDSHICLHCQKHIIGLHNYVQHKKYSCPMKRHDNSNPSEKVDIEVKQENLLTDIPSSKSNIESVARISTDLQDAGCGSTTQEKECIEKVRRRVGRPRKHKLHALKNPLQSVVDCQHSKSTADPCHSITHADQPSNRNLIQAQKKSSKGVLHCQGRCKKQPLQDERKEKLERPSENEIKAEQMLQQQEAHCDQEKPEECSFGKELKVDHLEGALDKSERTIIRKVGRPYALKDHEERVHVPRRVGRPRKQSYLKNDQASSEVQHASETDKFDATTDSAVRSRRSWNTFVKSTNSDGSTTTKTSPRRRHQRYDGSDLYKPRLSFGGSRQHTQEKRSQSDTNRRKSDSLLSPRKLKRIKVDKEERMENTVNNVKPKLQTATSPNRDSADDLNHLSSISANRQSCLSNHKRQHACSSPEPEIVAVLCSLKLQCQSESGAVENPEPHDGRTDHVPVALTLVNLLNELCFEDDLKGLDYLPDLGYSDLESHGLHSSKESDGMHRITVNNCTYVLVPSCQKCNRCFINTLAYHSHLRSSQCQKEDDEVLADEEPSQASPEQLSQTRAAFKQGNMIAMELTSTESVQSLKNSGVFSEACSICSAVFDNKYAYIRHLLHSLHLDQIQDHSVQRLILPLKLYQCHLCSFYCDDHSDFLKHMGSLEHSEVVDHITEDMFCPVCDFRTSSKKNMYLHFRSLHDQPPVLNTPVFLKEVDNPHSCQFCGKPFLSSRAVNIHIAVEPGHRKGGQHSTWCDICEKAFSTTSNLQQHLWRMHDNTKNFTCLVCHKSFSYKNNLDMHYKSQMHRDNAMMWQKSRENQSMSEDVSHSKKDISAEHKTEGLASGVTIKQEPDDTDSHTGNECDDHGSEENLFTKKPVTVLRRKRGRPRKNSSTVSSDSQLCHCELCGFKIYSLKQLQKHQQSRYHARTVEDAAKSSDCFVCSVCEHKFYCKERFALHKLAHRDKSRVTGRGIKGVNRLKGIPERFHKLALSLPKKVKSEVQCPECEGWFKANTIIPHIRCKHADGSDLPYKCNFCPLAFPSNSSLYRHHKRHVGLLSFKCTICSKGFRSKSDLESHELMIHKDELHIEAKLQCSLCGAGFMQQSKLNTHIKEKHEKLRKYWCAWPGCHRAFIHQQEYVIHMRGHTGEKPYLCDHCGFATKSKVQLARHERIHMNVANYKCKYCPYTSRMSAGLRRHMRLHTGAKPYKCPHCEHRCYSHTNLRLHINNSRLHPSLKLYNCHYCQFATNATTEFLNHMFEAHSLRPEVIGNVAEYCGVYLPKEDITEVKEGCMPIQLTKRKPRCKVSSRIKPSEEAMSEQEIVLEQDEVERTVSMKGESDVNDICIVQNDESLVDQSNVHQGLHENKIISYHQISGEKAQKIVNKHNDQQYNVLSILKTPGGKIMVVNECLAEGQFVNNEQQQEQHQQQQEENIVYDSQSLETLYIPKAEKEEVIQYDTNESSTIIQTDPSTVPTDPGPNYTITDSIKPANTIYLQDDEQIIITEQNEEHHLIGQVPEAVGSDLKENEIRLEDAAMTEPVKEVYLAPEGIQLTELIQGLEETGAVVELRVDSDYDLPEGEPGQVIQVIGDDNKPVNLYYV